jgi:hypothetical protein
MRTAGADFDGPPKQRRGTATRQRDGWFEGCVLAGTDSCRIGNTVTRQAGCVGTRRNESAPQWRWILALGEAARKLRKGVKVCRCGKSAALTVPGRGAPAVATLLLNGHGGVSPRTAVGLQDLLAEAQRFRRDLNHFVVGDELDGLFEIKQARRSEANGVVGC